MKKINRFFWGVLLLLVVLYCIPCFAEAQLNVSDTIRDGGVCSKVPWWIYPAFLFALTFVIGILAVLGGVGGGVLYVPIVSAFFPFHIDFVRASGLIIVLAGSLSAGSELLRKNLANLRLAIPSALIASISSMAGAMIGLSLPANIVQILLGITILFVVIVMVSTKKSDFPEVKTSDFLARTLRISGSYYEESLRKDVEWQVHNTFPGFLLFTFVGLISGMFGLGAGWANVPVLNLLMGAPLKISVATSNFILSISDTSASWVYLHRGAALPVIVVPSILGMMLGSGTGARILAKTKAKTIRWLIIGILIFSSVVTLCKGLKGVR